MLTQMIRRKFLEYFKKKQHAIVPSSPVVPHDDPSLLFINAGMNQFKDVFLGKSQRDYTRATTSQKCIRVGGKHNDLENVGHTTRHLTFFEMLGNFSFGDYFKKDAIAFAWEVSTQVFGLEADRIWPTVFRDDDESFELWTHYVPAERITRFGEKENFWSMGDTGPCGPCSELLYDRGDKYGHASKPSEDFAGERYLEFWNLVFMQFNRHPHGDMTLLPKPSIDTGSGLERVLSLKMGVESVFETDVLRSIIAQVESVTGHPYHLDSVHAPAFRVIADHLRCLSFAIADGVQPSNVDRGYVLRKILRRAVRYGRMLNQEKPFLAQVLPQLVATMGADYPELVKSQDRIAEILTNEEEAFLRTLKRGGNILSLVTEKAQATTKIISGDDAFKLKDTYGMPLEEILLIAKDTGLNVDEERYHTLEVEAKQRSRNTQKTVQQVAGESIFTQFLKDHGPTDFVGYKQDSIETRVLGLVVEGDFVDRMEQGQEGLVLLATSPFYAEMGGQVGDIGLLEGSTYEFAVEDTIAPYKGIIAHKGRLVQGHLHLEDTVTATIDAIRRQKIANNHTATHLLHWALHKVLGEHIKQAGSVVDAQRLRFDFSHHKPVTLEEIRRIEDLVNQKIRENLPVQAYELKYEDVQKCEEIKQFFGEKYGSTVRVIDIDYSKELCGGTHTSAVGTIGLFRIAKESSIAAGIRRIEAVTGAEAELLHRQNEDLLQAISEQLKAGQHQLQERVEKLVEENRAFQSQLKEIKRGQLQALAEGFVAQKEQIGKAPCVIAETALNMEELKLCMEQVTTKLTTGIAILGTVMPDKCQVMVSVSQDLITQGFSANELLKVMMPVVEGSGGGKQNSAQGGGKASNKLGEALKKVREQLIAKA